MINYQYMISNEEKNNIYNFYYNEKFDQRKIAKIYNVSQDTIKKAMKRFGFVARTRSEIKKGTRKLPRILRKKLYKLFVKGYTRREIAEKLHISFNVVSHNIKQYIPCDIKKSVLQYKLKKGGQVGKKFVEDYNKKNPFRPFMRGDNNPSKRQDSREKILKHWRENRDWHTKRICSSLGPSAYEKKIMKLNELYKLGLEFVGDGKLSIGGRCPDFVKDKKLIEVYYDWFKERSFGSCEAYEDSFRFNYASHGYEVLFLNQNDMTKGYPEVCLEKIQNFLTPMMESERRG